MIRNYINKINMSLTEIIMSLTADRDNNVPDRDNNVPDRLKFPEGKPKSGKTHLLV